MKYLYGMNYLAPVIIFFSLALPDSNAQSRREDIYTDFVLYSKRILLSRDLHENVITHTFAQMPDSNNEHRFEAACASVSQYMVANEDVKAGFDKLFAQYDVLQFDTKRALLEAVYAVYEKEYTGNIQELLAKEKEPALFTLAALYLYRADTSVENANNIKIRMVEQFPTYDSLAILLELEKYLNTNLVNRRIKTPPITDLFRYQRTLGHKIIYSFQRWNRDYPGLAIVQNADGRFFRNPDGSLMVFQQLARSGSNLPYFVTNGNTPQGVYAIRGTAVANNKLIGPTPNLQMIMPNESKWEKYFQLPEGAMWDTTRDVLNDCKNLLPPSWRNYAPAMEAFYAGKTGRRAIIAHGSTIDPEYFKDKPFYPLTPTMGCLCAKELWNISNGHLLISEQYNLVGAFTATPGYKGYLYVINVDDQQKPVTRAEVETWVREFEKK